MWNKWLLNEEAWWPAAFSKVQILAVTPVRVKQGALLKWKSGLCDTLLFRLMYVVRQRWDKLSYLCCQCIVCSLPEWVCLGRFQYQLNGCGEYGNVTAQQGCAGVRAVWSCGDKLTGPEEPVEGQAKCSPKHAFVMVFQTTAVMQLSFECRRIEVVMVSPP